MRRLFLMCLAAVLLTAGFANAATIRYQGSGSWSQLATPTWTGTGWQSLVAPGTSDTVRASWANNTITLNYATTVGAFQAGVDESGTFQIDAGGVLTATGSSLIGNNNFCTGTMKINASGVVNVNGGTLKVGGGSGTSGSTVPWTGPTTGILEVNGGTLTTASGIHLWCASGGANTRLPGGITCYATININAGGVINVGGNIGLGSGNGSDQSAGKGTATLNVNDLGTLNLYQWGDWNTTTSKGSIQPGSVLNISGTGKVVINGNKVAATTTYVGLGRIKGYGGNGTISAVHNSVTNKTTITAVSKMAPSPANGSMIGAGTVALGWTNMDPNFPGQPVYVDVWYGSDKTWVTPADPNFPPYYVDFTKIVAGQNTTTTTVAAPILTTVPTRYYWRVDSHIYGAVHNNDPNFPVKTGEMFWFDATNDFPPEVVIVTPSTNMVTWANQSIQMDATVTDTGTSAKTIAWTSNPAGVVFTPSAAVEDPAVAANPATFPATYTVTCSVWDAQSPTVINTAARNVTVYANACAAARRINAQGIPTATGLTRSDVDGDCDTDLTDLFNLLSNYNDWMTDYTIQEPTAY
jgi:hypothetical protein